MEKNNEGLAFTHDDAKKGTQLINKIRIQNSNLYIVGNDEKGWAIVIGKKRITEWMATEKDVWEYIFNEEWDLITRIVATFIELNEQLTDGKKYDEYVGKPEFPLKDKPIDPEIISQ